LLGVGLLMSSHVSPGSRVDPLGAVVLILASASWAWGSVLSKTAQLPPSPFVATSMEMIAGGTLLLLTAAIVGQLSGFHPARVSANAGLAWGYLVIFGSLVGFTAYIWLLGATSIAKAGTYAYVNPLLAVLLGWAILGEAITPRMVIATLVILVGVALVNVEWPRRRERATALQPSEYKGLPSSDQP
jgi:drug/metabolite transporter (DMT)-like permease